MNQRIVLTGLLVASILGIACCPSIIDTKNAVSKTAEQTKRDLVTSISNQTVALVKEDEEGDLVPYCGGVWVSSNKIVTAFHCVAVGSTETGKITYTTFSDGAPNPAKILDFDIDNDIALLTTDTETTPTHDNTEIATEVWNGQHVNIMGHTVGLSWTYMEGVVSSVRTGRDSDKIRRLIQVSSPAWHGNSGGGVWDDKGRLLGISSLVSSKGPNIGFFIHFVHVERLLGR